MTTEDKSEINNFTEAGLLLGTNLGNKKNNIETALMLIEKTAGEILKRSSFYETAAWGKQDQPSFYNMAVIIKTALDYYALLSRLLNIELAMGRIRKEKWGARLIDIDILYFGNFIIQEAELTIPHGSLPERKFALVPLAEIFPGWVHPVSGKKLETLLNECPDPLPVKKLEV